MTSDRRVHWEKVPVVARGRGWVTVTKVKESGATAKQARNTMAMLTPEEFNPNDWESDVYFDPRLNLTFLSKLTD